MAKNRCHPSLKCLYPAAPPLQVFCRKHWAMLPKAVKNAVLREAGLRESERWACVSGYAIYKLCKQLNLDAAGTALVDSLVRREVCRQRGKGDPLMGIPLHQLESEASANIGAAIASKVLFGSSTEEIIQFTFDQFNSTPT